MTSTAHPKFNFLHISVIAVILCSCDIILAFNSPNFKLPSAIFPTKYHLHITTYIHQDIFTYNGSVSIDLLVRESTNEIVLNAKRLQQLVNLTLINRDSGVILQSPQLEYQLDEEKEQLRISCSVFPLVLHIGEKYLLIINFLADIQQEEIRGFFKSSNSQAYENYITYFEPTSARLAFPCFDEPAFKAKFIISITHGSNYSAISNMPTDGEPLLSSTLNGQMVTTKFLESPPMSTYLVAFALTNYKNTSMIVNGLEHRFFYPPNSKDNGSLALKNSLKTIDALEKILGIKYTLPKLDYIRIQKSYGTGMENWGLITIRESETISDQKMFNKLELVYRIFVQNHEIAHQWFGNLVTPASWDCFWLKEGLSTFFGLVARDFVYPEEKFFEYFLLEFEGPENFNSPLTSIIKEGADIKEQFGIVAYQFGARLIKMVHHAIGQRTFSKGIFKYLSKFQYSIADEDDFFESLQTAVDEDNVHLFQNNQSVANVMRTWTHNTGMPTITIIRNYDTDSTIITIRQKSNTDDKDQKWWIPMNFATASNPDFERTAADYIMPPQAEVTLDLKDLNISLSRNDWLIVNKQQTGLFYVAYDDHNLNLIAEALSVNPKTIHMLNRAVIFRDLMVTFDEKFTAVKPILGLLEYLKLEEEPLPWQFVVKFLMKLTSKGIYPRNGVKNYFENVITRIKLKQMRKPDEITAVDILMLSYEYLLKS